MWFGLAVLTGCGHVVPGLGTRSHLRWFVVPGLNRAFDWFVILFAIVPNLKTADNQHVYIILTMDQMIACDVRQQINVTQLFFSLSFTSVSCHM